MNSLHSIDIDQQAIKVSDWLIPMDEIEMGDHLGAGSYGEVRIGRWRETEVAVKIIFDSSNVAIAEFHAEVLTMVKLRHPNIVP